MTMDTDSELHSLSKSAYSSDSEERLHQTRKEDATTNTKKRDPAARKLGEILYTESGKFFFVCSSCDIKYATCNGILKHIKSHLVEKEQRNAPSLAEPEFVYIDVPRLKTEIKTEITLNDEDLPIPMDKTSSLESTKKDDITHCTAKSKTPPPTKVVKIVKLKRIKPNPRLIAMKKKTLIEAHLKSYSKMPSNLQNIKISSGTTPKKVFVESHTRSNDSAHPQSHTKSQAKSNHRGHPQPEAFLCAVCGSIQNTKGRLVEHMKLHENRKIECEYCGKQFRRFSSLRQHYWLHDQPSFACTVCSKVFKMQRYVDRHMAVHDEPKFQCRHCDSMFHFETVRRIHERSRHFVV